MTNEILDDTSLKWLDREAVRRKTSAGFIMAFAALQIVSQLQNLYELVYGSTVLRIIALSYPETLLFLFAGVITMGIGISLYFNKFMIWSAVTLALLVQLLAFLVSASFVHI